jgi:ABC-type molybdate transport system permease subunit
MSVTLTISGCVMLILGPMVTMLAYKFAALKGWKQKLVIVAMLIPLVLAAILVDHVFEQFLESFGYKF